jgi:tetratricopeptide (TPR) repeat protein
MAYFNRGIAYGKSSQHTIVVANVTNANNSLGQLQKAISDYTKAADLDPKEEAKKDLQKAAELEPALKESVQQAIKEFKLEP